MTNVRSALSSDCTVDAGPLFPFHEKKKSPSTREELRERVRDLSFGQRRQGCGSTVRRHPLEGPAIVRGEDDHAVLAFGLKPGGALLQLASQILRVPRQQPTRASACRRRNTRCAENPATRTACRAFCAIETLRAERVERAHPDRSARPSSSATKATKRLSGETAI